MPKSINNVSVGYKFDIRKGDDVTYCIKSHVKVPDVKGTCVVHHVTDGGVVWIKTARLGKVPLGTKEVIAHSYCNRSLRIKATALVKAARVAVDQMRDLLDCDNDGFVIDFYDLDDALAGVEKAVREIPNAQFPFNSLR